MASTIKLKNSNTAGNAPSSLEQGEVAINVADGNLFYGDGSSVLQNFAFNHITASGDISASGRVYGTHFGTGNANRNALDLGTDNTMQFRVNDGSRLTLTSTVFRPTSDEGVSLGRTAQKWSELVVNNITASGDISASGTIYGRQLEQHDMGAGSFTPSTSTTFFPFGGQTRDESTGTVNQNIQKISIVPGKPRKVVIRAVNAATGLGTQGFTCSYHSTNIIANGTVTVVGAKYANSTGNAHEAVVFDFTSGVDEGSYDDVLPNRRIYMSLKADDNSLSAISVLGATALWEWDYNA